MPAMRTPLPTIFVNHGGGPLPLLGRQPELAKHMTNVPKLIRQPSSIVVLSAHWEGADDVIQITSNPNPSMLFDYFNFPEESYAYKYPAPGNVHLAQDIQAALQQGGVESKLDETRGFDHGVFVPLMLMYPQANIPVVCVSLHASLNASKHIQLGKGLSSLRSTHPDVLFLGSGYTFHNLPAFFNRTDNARTRQASREFNEWLKETLLLTDMDESNRRLEQWQKIAPHALTCHPRAEHLLPLFVVAAAAGDGTTRRCQVIYDTTTSDNQDSHAVTGYLFE